MSLSLVYICHGPPGKPPAGIRYFFLAKLLIHITVVSWLLHNLSLTNVFHCVVFGYMATHIISSSNEKGRNLPLLR